MTEHARNSLGNSSATGFSQSLNSRQGGGTAPERATPTFDSDAGANENRKGFSNLSRFAGILLAGLFYVGLYLAPQEWPAVALLHRYFLGHPIAIVTTVLFWIALGQLVGRAAQTYSDRRTFSRLSDRDLLPDELHALAGFGGEDDWNQGPSLDSRELGETPPSDPRYLGRELIPAGLVRSMDRLTPLRQRIEIWQDYLGQLPSQISKVQIVRRISEVLDRQHRRGNAESLNDDLRDLSEHHADADHDALQFVRIIVWAIPMLGFLGTVVGITQTLGGLDFTDGAAAVERLKNGLYVAFDTTAVALVLSVLAIFIQFPVEKNAQRLGQLVEKRLIRLIPSILATDPAVSQEDDPFVVLKEMTREIAKTVQTSVQIQADLWRQTVDAAHDHWESTAVTASSHLHHMIEQSLGEKLQIALRSHTEALRSIQREGADQIDHRWQQWQTCLSDNARILLAHQKALVSLNQSMDTVQNGIQAATGSANLAEAMMTLARAVDILATRLPDAPPPPPQPDTSETHKTKPLRRNAA